MRVGEKIEGRSQNNSKSTYKIDLIVPPNAMA
jgi:hypothetical protein